jgi:hypothetical protein
MKMVCQGRSINTCFRNKRNSAASIAIGVLHRSVLIPTPLVHQAVPYHCDWALRFIAMYTNHMRMGEHWFNFGFLRIIFVGRDSSVGIATLYRLEGPGIESWWGRDFLHPFRRALGPTRPPMQRVPGLLPRGKAVGAWHWPPTHI